MRPHIEEVLDEVVAAVSRLMFGETNGAGQREQDIVRLALKLLGVERAIRSLDEGPAK